MESGGALPKPSSFLRSRWKLNNLHTLEHELRAEPCSCKKELHKRSARCPLLQDSDTFPMNLAERGLYVRTLYRES